MRSGGRRSCTSGRGRVIHNSLKHQVVCVKRAEGPRNQGTEHRGWLRVVKGPGGAAFVATLCAHVVTRVLCNFTPSFAWLYCFLEEELWEFKCVRLLHSQAAFERSKYVPRPVGDRVGIEAPGSEPEVLLGGEIRVNCVAEETMI